MSQAENTEEIDYAIVSDETGRNSFKRPVYIIGAIAAISALIGLGWWLYARQFVSTDDAFIEGSISVISSKVSAHVAKVNVEENSFVKKGDLLIELETAEADAGLAQARADFESAKANLDKAEANVALSKITGRAGINQASSNYKSARSEIEQSKVSSAIKQNAIDQAVSRQAKAAASWKQVQDQIPAAEAAIEQAKGRAAAAKSSLDFAKNELEREQSLYKNGVTAKRNVEFAQQNLSTAESNYLSAEKEIDIARSRLSALRSQANGEDANYRESQSNVTIAQNDYRNSISQIGSAASGADESAGRLLDARALPERLAVSQSDVSAAAAEVEKAQAALDQAELQLGYTKIVAPQDGFVSRKSVQVGQLVRRDDALMTITQGGIWIVANFKETQLEKIRPDQRVDIYIDAYPATTFRGRVESFQAGTGSRFSVLPSENATGGFVKVVQRVPVKIVFDEMPDSKKYLLVPGMSAVPRVHVR
ncbi:MAG: efflux RND transporter periplasmic adaptor subunit [Pyrinomonadaceae bacterium]